MMLAACQSSKANGLEVLYTKGCLLEASLKPLSHTHTACPIPRALSLSLSLSHEKGRFQRGGGGVEIRWRLHHTHPRVQFEYRNPTERARDREGGRNGEREGGRGREGGRKRGGEEVGISNIRPQHITPSPHSPLPLPLSAFLLPADRITSRRTVASLKPLPSVFTSV